MSFPGRVTYSWGRIEDGFSEVVASFSVPGANPFDLRLDAVGVDVDVRMNDVAMATSERESVRFTRDRTAVEIVARIDHDRIPRWWASHVANGEVTDLRIEPRLSAPGLFGPHEMRIPGFSQRITTDLPGSISVDGGPTMDVLGRTAVALDALDARWLHVDPERTEMAIDAEVRNATPFPLPSGALRYAIRMNDVTVSAGHSELPTIASGGTTAVTTRMAFDNASVRSWWTSHLERGERTDVEVDVRTSLSVARWERAFDYRYEGGFETDLLADAPRSPLDR